MQALVTARDPPRQVGRGGRQGQGRQGLTDVERVKERDDPRTALSGGGRCWRPRGVCIVLLKDKV